ncbi:DUF6777 domain-containing protein [Streptomyces sp. NPDC050392]|uniref:DUF6777 domain-containing protein n=1 Tax=Streptomyces sp. NPDC050392 TaxID=3155782 RepID=UPI0034468219
MHPPIRMRRAALAVLSAGILVTAGCARGSVGGDSGTEGTADTGEILLQPAADRGSDPFTRSTAKPAGVAPAPTATASRRSSASGGEAPHTLPGSTPGLYGGTRSVASCDVGEQIRFLADDPARQAAFARAAGVSRAGVADFLRGLTPVLLSADTRVGNHGFRAGSATTYQSVLQAGTAVMVDGRGLPRVRCACGNPLSRPAGAAGTATGETWDGYDPARIVVVEPAPKAVTGLVIVDVAHDAWIERPSGDEGAGDRTPAVPPPYAPGADITGPLPEATPTRSKAPKKPEKSQKPGEPTPSREAPVPEDCPPSDGATPPGEAVRATEEPAGVPLAPPLPCPTPTGVPSDDPTDGYPEPFPEFPTDEPTGAPVDPDDPPQDLVPPMTDEPQTAIRLPWQDDTESGSEDGPEPVGG